MPASPVTKRDKVTSRRLPVGAEVIAGGGVDFRVWAPAAKRVEVVLETGIQPARMHAHRLELKPEDNGYFSGEMEQASSGTLYRFRLNGGDLLPDPASRFQPEGPHGPSQVVDPSIYTWNEGDWPGVRLEGQAIYELHLGTFTAEGTWQAASAELSRLKDLGITVLEIMPVAEFPGRFGWGYDGVDLFAPTRLYGTPDDFRGFVDRAHGLRLAVILDVVYNHLGPDGNYLKRFSPDYFTDRYTTDWGEAVNYDGNNSGPVREFFIANAGYWIDEFHLDGLRLDATQNIYDQSKEHILTAVARRARKAAGMRSIMLTAENEPQETKLLRPPEAGGYGFDALWNDDFHHSARVALTGHNEAYLNDYSGSPQEFISALKWGFLYQGQWYLHQKKRRGTPARELRPSQFIIYLENHDQVSNMAGGRRLNQLTSRAQLKALTALTLLAPSTPLLFQGQEFASSRPFTFFADHHKELAQLVRKGRHEFLKQFPSTSAAKMEGHLLAPDDPKTFEACKLDLSDRGKNAGIYALHRDLLRLRREDPVFRQQRYRTTDGAVLGDEAFVLRFFGENNDDRLLVTNLGRDLRLSPAPEPLLAPPEERRWVVAWSSEDPEYDGCGTPPLYTEGEWRIPGHAAILLRPEAPPDRTSGL